MRILYSILLLFSSATALLTVFAKPSLSGAVRIQPPQHLTLNFATRPLVAAQLPLLAGQDHSGESCVMGGFNKILSSLNFWLEKRPVLSNIFQGVSIVAAGDLVSQAIEHRFEKPREQTGFQLDVKRTRNAGFTGFVFNGIALPLWYNGMYTLLPHQTVRNLAIKVASGMIVWGIGGNWSYMYLWKRLEGTDHIDAKRYASENLKEVTLTDWKIWPMYDALCFSVIPVHWQPFITTVASVGWGAFISYIVHRKSEKKDE
uniref:Uncharacterized protein n=1 Tax=Heterosigma akashiwo TaxID=2829 RepID=A0A7S4DCJ4_HETAK